MRKIGMDELRQKQMEVLDYVAAFCDENGIRYWIEGGTLLGAIRHKGYIPWDDDIDIAMLREDYTRFRTEFPEKSRDPKFVFRCAEDDKTWHLPFGKVMNTESLFLQDGHDLGINIDIFPMDDAPDDDALMDKMYRKRDRLKVLNAAQQNTGKPSGNVLRREAKRPAPAYRGWHGASCDGCGVPSSRSRAYRFLRKAFPWRGRCHALWRDG